jgi:hypothetical protein
MAEMLAEYLGRTGLPFIWYSQRMRGSNACRKDSWFWRSLMATTGDLLSCRGPMVRCIHFTFQIASLVSLIVIRLRRTQREALRDLEALASVPEASVHGKASFSESQEAETQHSVTEAEHV